MVFVSSTVKSIGNAGVAALMTVKSSDKALRGSEVDNLSGVP